MSEVSRKRREPLKCDRGKPYPCYACEEPCPEELKRRMMYEEEVSAEDEEAEDEILNVRGKSQIS